MSTAHSPEYQYLLARLREARLAAGLTQAEAAEALKRPQSFVSKCESGERRIDAIELYWFAHLYEKPLSHFFPPVRLQD